MRSSRSGPDPLDPGRKGFAHRGLHGPGIPENSLAAFHAALDLGAGIECDVRLSADGKAMVVHDHDLMRLIGVPLVVEETPAGALSELNLVGSAEIIPRLGDVLDLVAGRVPILVELKTCRDNASRLSEAVAADVAGYAGPVGVMSFDPRVCGWFVRNVPSLRRGLVIDESSGRFRRLSAIGLGSPHFLAVDLAVIERSWVGRARRKRPIYTWTVQSRSERAQAAVHADASIWEADGRP